MSPLRCGPVNQPDGATAVDVASMPRAMTQSVWVLLAAIAARGGKGRGLTPALELQSQRDFYLQLDIELKSDPDDGQPERDGLAHCANGPAHERARKAGSQARQPPGRRWQPITTGRASGTRRVVGLRTWRAAE